MKKRDVIFLSLFSAIILFFGVAIFIFPAQSFSSKENRSLAKMPNLSLDNLIRGEFSRQLGDFYADQFPFRDSFTSVYALSELSLGKSQVNGIVIGNDRVLAARDRASQNVSGALSTIESLCSVVPCVYIPSSSAEVFSSDLPESLQKEITPPAHAFSQDAYYKTDHHWTSVGAYLAYTEICDMLEITAFEEDYFQKTVVSDDFRGTAYARSCLPKWYVEPDTITLYRYENDKSTEVFYHDTNTSRLGFYDLSALVGSDKYRVFLGGNYARLSIKSEGAKPYLLLVKDSFANSVIPFLALHFNIEVIDPRYCSRAELSSLLQSNAENILFIMSEATLNECFN